MLEGSLSVRQRWLYLLAFLSFLLLLSSCGGGGSAGPSPPPPPPPPPPAPSPDFSLTVQPTGISVVQGASTTFVVGITSSNGFSAQVNISITGIPTGITVNPSQFSLSAGGRQTVTVSATTSAVIGLVNLAVAGVSGTLQHNLSAALTVNSQQSAMHPPLRTRYFRTDTFWDFGFLNFTPQSLILYHPASKRFFSSNTDLNRIDVFDAVTVTQIGKISVPAPWVGDFTPDGTTIYMGTRVGDVYEIDPVALTVRRRYRGVQIGPAGFDTQVVRVMADGRLALLGGLGGIPAVTGYHKVALWTPATNTLTDLTNLGTQTCPLSSHIMTFVLTADRMKLVMGQGLSGGVVCTFDPATGAEKGVGTSPLGIGVDRVLVPPNDTRILVPQGTNLQVYDADLFQVGQIPVGDGSTPYRFVLSFDGNTVFAFPRGGGGVGEAIDWRTGQRRGWITTFSVHHLESWITPMVADETGLIAGLIGEGVAFLDASIQRPAAPGSTLLYGYADVVQPSAGPTGGGTRAQIGSLAWSNIDQVYFGSQTATNVTVNAPLSTDVTTPAGLIGPVDVAVTATDGSLVMLPEAFSYGPSIVEVITTASPAEGGGTGLVYGYGLGESTFNGQAPGLQVSLGGQNVPITAYSPQPYLQPTFAFPFPLESFEFVIPPGMAGHSEDLTVSNAAGSIAAPAAIEYLPSITRYPLPSAVLVQGVYDPRRDLYYFTDQTQVRVFSKSQGQWLSPVSIPNAARLWGIAISPDGNRVAVADAGANLIHVYDPASPGTVSQFTLPDTGANQGGAPCAVAITDSGTVYYVSFYASFSGGWALHKLDTSNGTVTDYTFIQAGSFSATAYSRIILTSDNARLFVNIDGIVLVLDTATDFVYFNPLLAQGDYELALASNHTWMTAVEFLMDTDLNPASYLAYNQRQVWYQSGVYGEKLSPSGNLLFVPLLNGLDVFDGRVGVLRKRIALPFNLSPNYDALVVDGRENVVIAITGLNGDGIAVIDLRSLPEPPPLPYLAQPLSTSGVNRLVPVKEGQTLRATGQDGTQSNRSEVNNPPSKPRFQRIMNDLAQRHARSKIWIPQE